MNQLLKAGSCALVAGVLVSAAGAATTMRLQVSPAGAETWSSSLNAKPGDAVDIRVTVSFTGGPVTPIGLSSTIFQPTVSNWLIGGDVLSPMVAFGSNSTVPPGSVPDAPGQYGRVSPYAGAVIQSSARLFGHVHTASATTGGVSFLRIAQRQVTSWFGGTGNTTAGSGVNIKQWNVNSVARNSTVQPAFDTRLTDVVVFKFQIVLSSDTTSRTLVVNAPLEGMARTPVQIANPQYPYVGWYSNPDEEAPMSIADLPFIEQGFITVPGPGVLGVGLVGVVALRRRR